MQIKLTIAMLSITTLAQAADVIEIKSPTYESPQACQTEPGRDGHYAWRIIDGLKCWYRGEPGVARERLYWSSKERPRRARPRAKEGVPLPPTPPTEPPTATPPPLPEDLAARLNYYFAVLSAQTAFSVPTGAVPLALAGPWLGTPIPPGLQPVPPAPADWDAAPKRTTPVAPVPEQPTWSERLRKTLREWTIDWWHNRKETPK